MFWSTILIILVAFTWGYLVGKPTGIKDGYRNCMREVLKARCEGRTSIGTSYDDYYEKQKAMNLLYGKEYESEEL